MSKDSCPSWDNSQSYYDNECGEVVNTDQDSEKDSSSNQTDTNSDTEEKYNRFKFTRHKYMKTNYFNLKRWYNFFVWLYFRLMNSRIMFWCDHRSYSTE